MIIEDQAQLDRIERMLTDLTDLKVVLLKIFLPKVPGPMRENVLRLMASRQGSQDWDD